MKTLLLTGFDPWGGIDYNPSWEMIKDYKSKLPRGWGVEVCQIPVSWKKSSKILKDNINENVKAIVSFGMLWGDKVVCEQVAHNGTSGFGEDNDGELPTSDKVCKGPKQYKSKLPYRKIQAALEEKDIPCSLSEHAGLYLCNYVFYWLSNYGKKNNIPVGFFHVPVFDSIEKDKLCASVDVIVKEVIDYVKDNNEICKL